jgi:hypothetical protein
MEIGDKLLYDTEPIKGRGLFFEYGGNFEIGGSILHIIKTGVFSYNVSGEALLKNLVKINNIDRNIC